MAFDLWRAGRHLGSIIRSGCVVYAYDASGLAIGTFADLDAAASALDRRAAA